MLDEALTAAAGDDAAAFERLRATADPACQAPPNDAAEAARTLLGVARRAGLAIESGRAAAWLCTALFRQGRYVDVRNEAESALVLLAHHELDAERVETLRLLVLSGCESGAFDVALEAAQRLSREAGARNDAGLGLTAAFALGACVERMGDPWQAARVLGDAVVQYGPEAPPRALMVALNGLAAVAIGTYHRLRGAAPAAECIDMLGRARAAAEQARSLLAVAADPVYEVAVLGNLGEVLLHQGEFAAAKALLDEARDLARQRGLAAYRWRVETARADWLMAHAHPALALQGMQILLEEMGEDAPVPTEIRARDAAYRACRALGRFEEALVHFERVERLERRRALGQLRAQSQLFVTRTEAQQAQWQAEQARTEALQQRQRAAEFARRAEQDSLTGLGNRAHLERRGPELLATAALDARPVALALLDLDNFKRVNDSFGHAAGDAVLVGLARVLREVTRGGDLLARLGGEEFVLMLPDAEPARAREVCERLRLAVQGHRGWPELPADHEVTTSVGLAHAQGGEALVELLRRADAALYRAKREGRNRVCEADGR